MPLAAVILAHLAGHLAVFHLWFRHRPVAQTERGIFLFHAGSFALCVIAAAVAGYRLGVLLPGFVLAASLHGIYSLSFLELWSLTQISYSLQILRAVGDAHEPVGVDQLTELHALGGRKQTARTEDLGRLGLRRADGSATLLGGMLAAALRFILWLTRGRPTN